MFETSTATYANKREHYDDLVLQARGLMLDESNMVANAANFSALIFNSLPQVL